MTYGSDNLPAHAQYMVDNYPNLSIPKISAKRGRRWMAVQDGVVLHLETGGAPTTQHGGPITIKLQLGKTSWGPHHGDNLVKSHEVRLTGHAESNNVADIQEAIKHALVEAGFGQSDSIYDDFIAAFGDGEIVSDTRSDAKYRK